MHLTIFAVLYQGLSYDKLYSTVALLKVMGKTAWIIAIIVNTADHDNL